MVRANNISSTNHDAQLKVWAKITTDCKEVMASSIKVKDLLNPIAFLTALITTGMPKLKLHI